MLEHGRRFAPAAHQPQAHRAAKLLKILLSPDYWRGARFGVAAGVEHESLIRRLSPRTIVDAGANRGQFSLAARRAAPKAGIVAFEPLPGPAGVFRRLFAGDAKVRLVQAALAPKRGRVSMHVSRRDDSSSLLPIGPVQTAFFPGTEETGTCLVEAGPLGDFLKPEEVVAPALLKIDVQGYELEALRACQRLLGRFAYVYVEASFIAFYEGQALAPEVVAYLEAAGFALLSRHNVVHAPGGAPVQADFLFRNAA